jgi:hypothetical protein
MDENDSANDGSRLPPLQAQQPQLAAASNTKAAESAAHEIWGQAREREAAQVKEGAADGMFDDARATAGLVGLYQELLKAPIPEDMLRLVRELETKERK